MAGESKFELKVIRQLLEQYPGAIILKNDPRYLQAVPDRLILYEDKWAALEFKGSVKSVHQVNQDYYVDVMDRMSFARFIYPENEEVVLNDLQQTFRPNRRARFLRR